MDYAKYAYKIRQHHERFARYVATNGLLCQDCCGTGRHFELVDPTLGGYYHDCGWCEGTGKVSRRLRGLWLREQRRR